MLFKRFKTGHLIGDFFDYTNIFMLENQGSFKNDKESFTTFSSGFGISMRRFFMLVLDTDKDSKKKTILVMIFLEN